MLQYLTGETGGLELASTVILVLQANRQTKCSSHPMMYSFDISFQKNTSQRQMLNSRSLKTDPYGTPERSSVHEQEAKPGPPETPKIENLATIAIS